MMKGVGYYFSYLLVIITTMDYQFKGNLFRLDIYTCLIPLHFIEPCPKDVNARIKIVPQFVVMKLIYKGKKQ